MIILLNIFFEVWEKWFCLCNDFWLSICVYIIGVRVSDIIVEIKIVIVRVIVNLWNSCLMILFINSSGINIVISEKVSEIMVKLILFAFLSVVVNGFLFFLI